MQHHVWESKYDGIANTVSISAPSGKRRPVFDDDVSAQDETCADDGGKVINGVDEGINGNVAEKHNLHMLLDGGPDAL